MELATSTAAAIAPVQGRNQPVDPKRPFAFVAGAPTWNLQDLRFHVRMPIPTAELKKAGLDAANTDPMNHLEQGWRNPRERGTNIGQFIPQREMIQRDELYAAMLTPSGNYTTKIAPGKAMRNGYRIVKRHKKTEPVETKLVDYIIGLTYKHQCYQNFALGMQLCEGLGQCVAYVRQVAPPGYKTKYTLDMAVLWEEDLDFDTNGDVKAIHPRLKIGYEERRLTINKGRFVMWRSERDPFGRAIDGQLQLVPAYNTIVGMEVMLDSYATIMGQRGMGLFACVVEGADEKTLQAYYEKYKNPAKYSTMWMDERFKPQVFNTVSEVLDISKAIPTYSSEFSKATGFPYQRMTGGTSDGKISGDATADKEAEAYSALQEKYEPYMILTLNMLDAVEEKRGLVDEDWELDWDIEVKMDRQKRSNMFTTEATAVNQVETLLTVNEAMERLGYPPREGTEGKMIYAEYKMKFEKLRAEMQSEIAQQRAEQQAALNPPSAPNGKVPEGEQNKSGKPIKAQQDPAAYAKRELNKETAGKALMNAKDDHGRWAYSIDSANEVLRVFFGQGMNEKNLSKLREDGS